MWIMDLCIRQLRPPCAVHAKCCNSNRTTAESEKPIDFPVFISFPLYEHWTSDECLRTPELPHVHNIISVVRSKAILGLGPIQYYPTFFSRTNTHTHARVNADNVKRNSIFHPQQISRQLLLRQVIKCSKNDDLVVGGAADVVRRWIECCAVRLSDCLSTGSRQTDGLRRSYVRTAYTSCFMYRPMYRLLHSTYEVVRSIDDNDDVDGSPVNKNVISTPKRYHFLSPDHRMLYGKYRRLVDYCSSIVGMCVRARNARSLYLSVCAWLCSPFIRVCNSNFHSFRRLNNNGFSAICSHRHFWHSLAFTDFPFRVHPQQTEAHTKKGSTHFNEMDLLAATRTIPLSSLPSLMPCHWGKINKIVSAVGLSHSLSLLSLLRSNVIFSFVLIRSNANEIQTTCNDCVEKFTIAICICTFASCRGLGHWLRGERTTRKRRNKRNISDAKHCHKIKIKRKIF